MSWRWLWLWWMMNYRLREWYMIILGIPCFWEPVEIILGALGLFCNAGSSWGSWWSLKKHRARIQLDILLFEMLLEVGLGTCLGSPFCNGQFVEDQCDVKRALVERVVVRSTSSKSNPYQLRAQVHFWKPRPLNTIKIDKKTMHDKSCFSSLVGPRF